MTKLNFLEDISYHKRVTNFDFVHHLMGNGRVQAMMQVTKTLTCRNALVLHLMNPERFENRPKSNSFTFHQQVGPELTSVGVYHNDHLYVPHPRQTEADLRYSMSYKDGIAVFEAQYPAEFTLDGQRSKSPFDVHETCFVPTDHPALVRRITVSNRRGLEAHSAKVYALFVPNQSLFPEAHFDTSHQVAVAGHFTQGNEFFAIAGLSDICMHQVAEFPTPIDNAISGQLKASPSFDDDQYIQPQERYTNYPLLPETPHLGAAGALAFDLGTIPQGESRHIDLVYLIGESESQIIETLTQLREKGYAGAYNETVKYWQQFSMVQTGNPQLDTFYRAVRAGIRAGVGNNGSMNAAIWGYNAEWVRDSSLASVGATLSGQFAMVRAMFKHMLTTMINEEGLTFGESQFYEIQRAELDQNGEFFYALWMYWVHSRDDSLIHEHWDQLCKIAEFPLRDDFWIDEAQMMKSERDIRERDAERHGLKPGFELAYQAWVSLGLRKASEMAKMVGDKKNAERWHDFGNRIWDAVINHPKFRLIENNYFMKRRLLDGTFQYIAKNVPYVHRANETTIKIYPRNRHREGHLEPDFSEAYPVTLGLVDPYSDLSKRTLIRMETLWNQEWDFGGYPLHNVDSEPTKLGAWPMPFYVITQAALEARNYDTVWRNLNWILNTKDGEGYTWWEYRDVNPDYQIDHGITPWFVYGEPIVLFVHYLLGFRPSVEYLTIHPHVLPELETVSARLRLGECWVDLTIHNKGQYVVQAQVNGENHKEVNQEYIQIPIPERDTSIEIWLEDR